MDTHGAINGGGDRVGDSTGERLLINRMGRGRSGGSTVLEVILMIMRGASRPVIIADGDVKNPTLSGLYPPGTDGGAYRPALQDHAGMKDWISEMVGKAHDDESSIIVDLGGGDRVMGDLALDMDLVGIAEDLGMTALGVYCSGADTEDIRHILSVMDSNVFPAKRQMIVFNEALVRPGRDPNVAFAAFEGSSEVRSLKHRGLRLVRFPRLHYMDDIRSGGLGLKEVMAGTRIGCDGRRLNPMIPASTRRWFSQVEKEFLLSGVLDWFKETNHG